MTSGAEESAATKISKLGHRRKIPKIGRWERSASQVGLASKEGNAFNFSLMIALTYFVNLIGVSTSSERGCVKREYRLRSWSRLARYGFLDGASSMDGEVIFG